MSSKFQKNRIAYLELCHAATYLDFSQAIAATSGPEISVSHSLSDTEPPIFDPEHGHVVCLAVHEKVTGITYMGLVPFASTARVILNEIDALKARAAQARLSYERINGIGRN